ncbi:MAG: DUF2892 domain-containing protein [Phycisphaeraceae bacterium]|nr:DUF2892 domain-containing protein [Phycisphaeraceae bacterium]
MIAINMGKTDRTVRLVLGAAAIAIGIGMHGALHGQWLGVLVAAIGVVFVLTSAVGFCPAYVPIGLSTCKRAE